MGFGSLAFSTILEPLSVALKGLVETPLAGRIDSDPALVSKLRLTLSLFSVSRFNFLFVLAGGVFGTIALFVDELASSGAETFKSSVAASAPDDSGAVAKPVWLSIFGESGASVLEPVCSGVAILGSKEHVSLSVEYRLRGVVLGIGEALLLGVALVASSGSDVHDLMEHGHSKRQNTLIVFPFKGQGADTDVGGTALNAVTTPEGYDISQSSGLSLSLTRSAGSISALAAHERVAVFFLQVIHGVLVSALNVFVVVGTAFAEPLLEAVSGPPGVGSLDDCVSTSNGVHDRLLLRWATVGVSCDLPRITTKRKFSVAMPERDVLHTFSVLEVSSWLSCGGAGGRSECDCCEDSACHEF